MMNGEVLDGVLWVAFKALILGVFSLPVNPRVW